MPPSGPTPEQISTTIKDSKKALEIAGDAQTYTAAGYATVEERCGEFFDKLTLYKNNSNFLSAQVATAGATAAGALALLSASTTAIGLVGMGAGLVASSIANFQNFAMVTPYPLETRQLVFAALQTAKTAKPASRVTDVYDARSTVAAYAQYCTYAGIASLSQQALQRGADNTVDAGLGKIPDVLRRQIANQAGGPLSDKQLALIVVLKDLTLTDAQRQAAVDAAALTARMKGLLLNVNNYLTPRGVIVAESGERLALVYPAFGTIVDQQRTAVSAGGAAPAGGPTPAFGTTYDSPPRPSVFDPVPTPRVIIGR